MATYAALGSKAWKSIGGLKIGRDLPEVSSAGCASPRHLDEPRSMNRNSTCHMSLSKSHLRQLVTRRYVPAP